MQGKRDKLTSNAAGGRKEPRSYQRGEQKRTRRQSKLFL